MKNATAAIAGAALVAAAAGAVVDYLQWRRLGVGGLPANPLGWLTVSRMRFEARDPLQVRVEDSTTSEPTGLTLPRRLGYRPRVARHPVPHRIIGEHTSDRLRDELMKVVEDFVEHSAPALEFRTSRWEKHNQALCLIGGGEIGHVHPSDASVHVILHPVDAQHAIDLGWGELHPLAGSRGLPSTYTLLYPPRTFAEVECIREVISAGVHHLSGAPRPEPLDYGETDPWRPRPAATVEEIE